MRIFGKQRNLFCYDHVQRYYILFCVVLQYFSCVSSCFLLLSWPPVPRCGRNAQQEHRNRGPGASAGRQRRTRRPVAAAAPRWPPGPERRRRERRGEPRRPGAREPSAERPPGGQPGRSGQRASASTVEGTAPRARRDRLPRTPGARAGRRGGRRVGDSGAGGQRPGGPQAARPRKRAGREPARPAAYRDSRRPRLARGRGEPLGARPTKAQRRERGEGPGGSPPAMRSSTQRGRRTRGVAVCSCVCLFRSRRGIHAPARGHQRAREYRPRQGAFPMRPCIHTGACSCCRILRRCIRGATSGALSRLHRPPFHSIRPRRPRFYIDMLTVT